MKPVGLENLNLPDFEESVRLEKQRLKQQRIDQFAMRVLPTIYNKNLHYPGEYDEIAQEAYEIAQAMEAERTRLMNED